MNIALKYTLKVWQTAVFVAPLLTLILNIMPFEGASDAGFIYLIGMLIGLIWSIPSFAGLIICVAIVSKSQVSVTAAKTWLSLAGIALSALPFLMMGVGTLTSGDPLFLNSLMVYASVIVASIWMFRLETQVNQHNDTVTDGEVSPF